MEFANPTYLYLLLLLLPLIAWYIIKLSRTQASFRLASTHAFRKMPRSPKVYLRHLPFVLRLITLALVIVVLARPQSINRYQTTESQGIDIVLAVDISGSMLAQDLTPDRLTAAKKIKSVMTPNRSEILFLLIICNNKVVLKILSDRIFKHLH